MPRVRAGDIYEFLSGPVVRVERVYYHVAGRCWVVEYDLHPRNSATKDLVWEPEPKFLQSGPVLVGREP